MRLFDEFGVSTTLRERRGLSRPTAWLLVRGNRWAVTAVILLSLYAFVVGVGVAGTHSLRELVAGEAVDPLFSSILIAVVTSVTLVLTVAQLVLSQEIGTLGDQRRQMREEIEFRTDVEEELDADVSPPDPSTFLQMILRTVDEDATRLCEAVTESDREEDLTDVIEFVDGLREDSERANEDLEGAEFGSFEVLLPLVNYNHSRKIHVARRLREEYGDRLDDEAEAAFDELIEGLRFFGPARAYVKAQYFRWEMIDVSRMMLYAAIPALGVAAAMIVAFDPSTVRFVGGNRLATFALVCAAFTVTLLPFGLLLAYILRILTVVKRSLDVGPFVLQESERRDEAG